MILKINIHLFLESSKNKCIFDSPILTGSEVLFNSKCNLYNYMYSIIPKLFGRNNIIYSFRDTDSITYKIKLWSYQEYLNILKENPRYFNKEMGLMENQAPENINEVNSLRSKSYSIQKVSDINIKESNNYKLRKSKGINKNYFKVNHTHEYFKKILFNKMKTSKAEYYKISLKTVN